MSNDKLWLSGRGTIMEESKFELVTLLLRESRLFDTKNCPNNCLIKIREREDDNEIDRTTLIKLTELLWSGNPLFS